MSIEGCPHGPIIDGSICIKCAESRKTKDPRVAELEEQMESIAKKMMRSCPSCTAKETRIKKLEKVVNKLSDEAAVYSWIKNYMFLHYPESPFIEYQEGRISLAKLCGLIAKNIRDLIETEIKGAT